MNYLNTYITRIENVSKNEVKQMLDYLENENHSNHSDTIFINNYNLKTFFGRNKHKIFLNEENRNKRKKSKGRKLKDSNKMITFNIPKDYKPTQEQIIKIQSEVIEYVKELYLKKDIVLNNNDLYSNIHFEKTKNRHINLMIPNLDNNGNTIRFIKEKSFLKDISKQFTTSVDNTLDTTIDLYSTMKEQLQYLTNQNEKLKSENLELVNQNEKLQVDLMEMEKDFENLENLLLVEIKDKKDKYKENKTLKRFYDYLYRIKSKMDKNKDFGKDIDRLIDTYIKIIYDSEIDNNELVIFFDEFMEMVKNRVKDNPTLLQEIEKKGKKSLGRFKGSKKRPV